MNKKQNSLIDPITNLDIPPILYKYRDSEKEEHLKVLENIELFFPSQKTFNDPFDCKIPVNFQTFADNKEDAYKYVRDFFDKNPQLDFGKDTNTIIEKHSIRI